MTRLEATNLSKRFGSRRLFRGLSFSCEGYESIAITGRNGSGKSTLIRILAGVLAPTSGTVQLHRDSALVPGPQRRSEIGFVAPYLNMYDGLTLRENLSFLARVRSQHLANETSEAVLETTGLLGRENDFLSTFSSGMKQRARFAGALIGSPSVFLLDEPTSNLDEDGRDMVARVVEDRLAEGAIVIIATNSQDEADRCSQQIRIESFLP